MKIAILINSLTGGGAERFVSLLIPYLENQGIDVHLVLINDVRIYDIKTKNPVFILDANVKNQSGFKKLIKIPILGYKYYKYLKKNSIRKSLSFLTRSAYISCMIKIINPKYNVIISERSYPSLQYGYNDLQSSLNKFLIKKLYNRANKIITNSNGNANDLISEFKIDKNKIVTVHNAISIKFIKNQPPVKDYFDEKYFNIISVGRLDEGKNHKILINAAGELNLEKIRIYIFGTGHLKGELNDLIIKLDLQESVFIDEFKENIFQFMKACDIFVFTSNHEGFPNVLIEAMACNLPLISTNCPSGPNEIFESNVEYDYNKLKLTDYGILVPMNNKKLLGEAIDRLFSDKEYYYRCKQSLQKRAEHFNDEKILAQFYNQLLIDL